MCARCWMRCAAGLAGSVCLTLDCSRCTCNLQARQMSDGDFIFEDKEDDEVWKHERRLRAKENTTQAAGALLPELLMHAKHHIAPSLQGLHKQHRGLLHAAAQSQPEVRGALDPDLLDLDSAYTAQRGESPGLVAPHSGSERACPGASWPRSWTLCTP